MLNDKTRDTLATARSRRFWPVTSLELRRFQRAEGALLLGRPRAVRLKTRVDSARLRRIVWCWFALDPTIVNRNLKVSCACIFLPRALLNPVRYGI